MVVAEKGALTVYDGVPDLTAANLGGVQSLPDGRVLVGSTGAIWVFEQGHWQKWVAPDMTEPFRLFALGCGQEEVTDFNANSAKRTKGAKSKKGSRNSLISHLSR